MKTLSSDLQALLATGAFLMADCFTITLVSGTVYRWTTFDVDISYGGHTFEHASDDFTIIRSKISWSNDLSTDTMDIKLIPQVQLTSGLLLPLQNGDWDAAIVQLDRVFMAPGHSDPTGGVLLFIGRVGDIQLDKTQVSISVKSHIELLNIDFPRNIFGPSCQRILYDAGCGVNKATYTFTGTITDAVTSEGGPADALSMPVSVSDDDGYFTQGIINFTSGLNAGLQRTVKHYDGGGDERSFNTTVSTGDGGSVVNVANDNGIGAVDWTDISKAGDKDSLSHSSTPNLYPGIITHYLKLSGFGFSIPSGATVAGIKVTIKGPDQSLYSVPNSYAIKLIKNGVISGQNKATGSGTGSTKEYGSSSDLWGLSLSPSDVNDPGFGVAISYQGVTSSMYPDCFGAIYWVSIEVTYTATVTPTVTLFEPLPFIPEAGNNITLIAGCDKLKSTCLNKFNNVQKFRGFPYIPSVETAF